VGPFYDLVIAGDDELAVERLTAIARTLGPAWAVSSRVPASGPDPAFAQIVVSARAKTAGSAAAKAYLCLEGSCKSPTTDAATLRTSLLTGWSF
jgi:hypothetical protein